MIFVLKNVFKKSRLYNFHSYGMIKYDALRSG